MLINAYQYLQIFHATHREGSLNQKAQMQNATPSFIEQWCLPPATAQRLFAHAQGRGRWWPSKLDSSWPDAAAKPLLQSFVATKFSATLVIKSEMLYFGPGTPKHQLHPSFIGQ